MHTIYVLEKYYNLLKSAIMSYVINTLQQLQAVFMLMCLGIALISKVRFQQNIISIISWIPMILN